MRFVTWLLTNAAGVAVAAWLLGGISFEGDSWQDKIVPLLLVALILGLVTVFVEPVVKLLSLPFIVLTIGLFYTVTTYLMGVAVGGGMPEEVAVERVRALVEGWSGADS